MKKEDLNTKYIPEEVEKNRYDFWLKNNLFKSDLKSKKPGFSIILPPPNVTGKLHLGHAWDGSLQDALIRFKKLNGFDTLYIPGMDHAGIATQTKVETNLKQKGISRFDIGRDKFIDEIWKWKDEYANTIKQQWSKLGLALDYSVENFTLNTQINDLVNFVFVSMYQKGLIYKDKKIVNWDPIQKTAISNIEVIYKEVEGKMYYFKYQIENSKDYLQVATTRPETMFGDQAVVINPKDKRYQKYIGLNVINPVNSQIIPIIADDYVETDFGTGVMKCTPAHDLNDFDIGKRHGLKKVIVMNEDGTINHRGGKLYENLDRFDARKKIIDQTTKNNTFIKEENIIHQVGFSERTNAIVEPYLSNQWFVKMDNLAKSVLELQKSDNAINFFPERFNQQLEQWMTNSYDWTISRQLWWGHQIPAWYHKTTNEIYVGINPPIDEEKWTQDPDVLDTWFSSALWPFATLFWTQDNSSEYFDKYYPTNVLVTGYDIIFFWVARMIFQSLEFTKQKPFNDVLIHGLVRDEQGRKMSKSLGNGIDPMDLIKQYGSDSLRFFLLTNSTPGQDIKYSEEKIKNSWNFMNKLWNAARYVLMNLESDFIVDQNFRFLLTSDKSNIDKWILNELTITANQVKDLIDKYEFAVAGKIIYDFVWSKFCSWYIEFAKVNLSSTNENVKNATKQTLFYTLKNILIMLHPFAPFITEEIYQQLNLKTSIMLENWFNDSFIYDTNYINLTTDLITIIREFKNTNNLNYQKELEFKLSSVNNEHQKIFDNYLTIINEFLTKFVNSKIIQFDDNQNFKNSTSIPIHEFFLEIENNLFINKESLISELKLKKENLEQEIKRSESMLSNKDFMLKASKTKIEEEKKKYKNYLEQLESIKLKLDTL